ncbi:hypothetical protein Bbelb_229800 [Branchiostoma belcheri]|nr:hypothetical protein Bbelb_229800 [Branchiostoma belcheri]
MKILLVMFVSLVVVNEILPKSAHFPFIGILTLVAVVLMGLSTDTHTSILTLVAVVLMGLSMWITVVVVVLHGKEGRLPPAVRTVFLRYCARALLLGDLTKPSSSSYHRKSDEFSMSEYTRVTDTKPSWAPEVDSETSPTDETTTRATLKKLDKPEPSPEVKQIHHLMVENKRSLDALKDFLMRVCEAEEAPADPSEYVLLTHVLDRMSLVIYLGGLVLAYQKVNDITMTSAGGASALITSTRPDRAAAGRKTWLHICHRGDWNPGGSGILLGEIGIPISPRGGFQILLGEIGIPISPRRIPDPPGFQSPLNAVYARPPLTFLEGPSYRSESFELHKILRAVRRGKFSAPAKFTPAPPTPSQSLASLDATLPGRRLNVAQTLHKLRWSGCKRFTSGHEVAGTVSGVEAAIHVGNELWFGVGIEVSERDQNLAISTVRNGPVTSGMPLNRMRYTNACVTAIPKFATAKPTLKQRRLQRNAPAKFGQCDRAFTEIYVYEFTEICFGEYQKFNDITMTSAVGESALITSTRADR